MRKENRNEIEHRRVVERNWIFIYGSLLFIRFQVRRLLSEVNVEHAKRMFQLLSYTHIRTPSVLGANKGR
jgi:membrane protein CcdC involved in cytochrome C biogenesis